MCLGYFSRYIETQTKVLTTRLSFSLSRTTPKRIEHRQQHGGRNSVPFIDDRNRGPLQRADHLDTYRLRGPTVVKRVEHQIAQRLVQALRVPDTSSVTRYFQRDLSIGPRCLDFIEKLGADHAEIGVRGAYCDSKLHRRTTVVK